MINSLKALRVSLGTIFRRKVTAEYPDEHLPIQDRYMGFPALTWDYERDEPFCTGCMVCVRYCPTQCMSAQMQDNPRFTEGDSHRKKIIQTFEINYGRCILCAICVDVCNFDAIEMSYEHELGDRMRNGNRVDLPALLTLGKTYQQAAGWKQSKPNAPSPKEREAIAAAKAAREAADATDAAADDQPVGGTDATEHATR
jgi:NADH-quinone oxidoreductase subunit I